MKKIGIVPFCALNTTENEYDDKYFFTNTYPQRLANAGALPIGVLPVDGRIKTPILEECDAFVIQGGKGIMPYHMDMMDYAVKNNKKVLGICLGMQTIHTYFAVLDEAKKQNYTGDIAEFYANIKKAKDGEGKPFLENAINHRFPSLPYGDKSSVKHKVLLTPGSHIAQILGTTEVMGASFHTYCVGKPASVEIISGRAEDGTIEANEYGTNIIGTQFHPDVDDELLDLFRWVAE